MFFLVELISEAVGVQYDLVMVVVNMALCILLSPLFHVLKSRLSRTLFSLLPGLFTVFSTIEWQWSLYVVLFPIFFYFAIQNAGRYKLQFSMILGFLFISFVHYHRYFYDYLSWKLDCSTTVMYLTAKLTYYGFYLSQKDVQKHSILDFMAYCFFFPSVNIGPTFSFTLYLNFIERRENFKNIRFSLTSSLPVLVSGILLMALTTVIIPRFPPDWVLKNQTYANLNFFLKVNALLLIGFMYRIKFYAAWYITQAAVNYTGLSDDGTGVFDQVTTGSILFEFNSNPKIRTEYWNTSIQKWLKEVIFAPISTITKSNEISTYLTFLASALWHGVYLTYYIGFIQWGVVIHLTKWFYKWSLVLPQWLTSHPVVKLATLYASSSIMSAIGMQIVILDWNNAMKFNQDLHYYHLIALFSLLILSSVIRPPRPKKVDKKSEEKEVRPLQEQQNKLKGQ